MPLLRAPLVLLRWLAVLVGVLGWLVVVPLMELWKALVRRLKRQ